MQLDHIAICGSTLEDATTYAQDILGATLQPGGQHERFGTHNTLLGLEDGLYLEALSMMPDAPPAESPRMFGVNLHKGPPRLTNWICRCDDLDATLANLPDGFGEAVDVARGDFRWRMAVPQAGYLPFDNCAPAFIQWLGDKHPAPLLDASGIGLTQLTVQHPQAAEMEGLLAPLAGDHRITFKTGSAQLSARLNTPSGTVML